MRFTSCLFALAFSFAATAHAAPPERPEPPDEADGPEPLGHKHLVDEQRHLPRADLGGAPDPATCPAMLPGVRAAGDHPIVRREVLGYLPYWSYTAATPYVPLRWDLLTILAWFSANMDGSGAITDKNGWGGAMTAAIVQDAHAHGVRVIVTVTNFTGSQITSIVSAANRQRAIDSCLALMAEHDADGINIDFEFVPKAARADFVTFMSELTDAVRAAAPNGGPGHVSLAGPAIDWSGAYDYDQLLENTDGIMVMAYGYHWSGSTTAGPSSPLFSGDLWASRSVSWTIDDYLTYGGTENRGHVIIGLPWYGRSWKVADETVPADALSSGATKTFKAAEPEARAAGKLWEDQSKSTYYHKRSGGDLSQVWYDDGRSFEEKIAYIDQMDLGGVGIWALGYEGDYPDLWDAIAHVLATVGPDPDTSPESVEVVEPVEPVEVVEPVESVEPAPEPTPESSEPGPEPSPEVVEVVAPDEDGPDLPDIEDRPGTPYATPLVPQRTVRARSVEGDEGCGASGSSLPAALVALAGLAVLPRISRYRGR